MVATTAPTIASVDAEPSIAQSTATTTSAGAMTRTAVSVCGRGASVARRPAPHASHSSVAAATRGASDHCSIVALTAGPAVTGNVTHATRSNQRKRGRGRDDSVRGPRARLERASSAIVEYRPMSQTLRAPVLVPGVATGIGSLPHDDPVAAAELVLRCLPDLPAAPQLPARDPREGMLAQWLGALPEVTIAAGGGLVIDGDSDAAPVCDFTAGGHDGLVTFLEVAAAADKRPARVKVQVTGPLTLGVALRSAGVDGPRAFRRAAEVTRVWSTAIEELVATTLPGTGLVLFFDEPALVSWQRGEEPLDRESAIDVLSGA